MTTAEAVAADLERIRATAPLVHNITNYVVMNTTANALLAIGASPVMAHAVEEVEDMVRLAGALVVNIGTLSPAWVEAMLAAGREARRRSIPVVLDPVGAGATPYRTETAHRLIGEVQPTIIRGNASEFSALARGTATRGVDTTHTVDEVAEPASRVAAAHGAVVSVSGPTDLILAGASVTKVMNGHRLMQSVTGMGCAASALTGAFAAVNPDAGAAAVHAMVVMGIAGEMAAGRAGGPGTFWPLFLDALAALSAGDIAARIRVG
jgi:hydroxyethylthiazole kinase